MLTIKAGLILLCSYSMYAPGMNRSGSVTIKNVTTQVHFVTQGRAFVQYEFKDNENIYYPGTNGLKIPGDSIGIFEIALTEDLQTNCKEEK